MEFFPAGAIGMTLVEGESGLVSRAIARRQAVPYSHAVIALGNGRVLDQPWPRTRIRSEEEWREARKIHWWVPTVPFGQEEVRKLRSLARFSEGRISYSWRSILSYLFRGRATPDRSAGLYCTQLVAELYLVIRGVDFSGIEQPWGVDVRTLLGRLRDDRDFIMVPDEDVHPMLQ
jgi:hypothetical protein